jgi:exonuclease III
MNEAQRKWVDKLRELNDKINSFPVWNERAQDLQTQYDRLLTQRPKD